MRQASEAFLLNMAEVSASIGATVMSAFDIARLDAASRAEGDAGR